MKFNWLPWFELLFGVAAQVTISVHSRWPTVVAGSQHTQALLVDLTPPVTGEVPPQELALVVDISMSMAEKLSLVKSAVRQILHGLRSEDRIHLISFHSFARPEFINGTVERKAQLLQALEALEPKTNLSIRPIDGSDPIPQDMGNISEGLWIAQRLLVSPIASTQKATRRAMLFSDGQLRGGMARYNAAVDAFERCKVAGVPSTVVAVGQSGFLREAAKAAQGGFIHLHGPEGFQQVVAAASASHFPLFATDATLRLATAFGARLVETYSHRRRRGHQRPWTEDFVLGAASTDDELPLGALRQGRTERKLIVLDLPVYNRGFELLKYELLYQQLDGTSVSQWEQFTQHVALPETSPAVEPAADLLFRLDRLLSEREDLRLDEEAAEAQSLPVPIHKGDASRWSRLSERWRSLRTRLESLATEAAASQKQLPSLGDFGILEQIWMVLETTKLAGRGHAASDWSRATADPFGVCEGSPPERELASGSPAGLSLPNSR